MDCFQIITLIFIIVGWAVIYWLNSRQQKKDLINKSKLKIYEELYSLKKKIDNETIKLRVSSYLSFTLSDVKKAEVVGKPSPLDLWQSYTKEISRNIDSFVSVYLEFWTSVDAWIETMPELKRAKNELLKIQTNTLMDDLLLYRTYLSRMPSLINYKWGNLDFDQIEEKAKKIREKINKIAIGYTDDFIGLVHNVLIAPIFGHEKKPRENFENLPEKFTILTKNGIEEVNKSQKKE